MPNIAQNRRADSTRCIHGLRMDECAPCIRKREAQRSELLDRRQPVPPKPARDPDRVSNRTIILRAAIGLGEVFSRTALVLAAWDADKERFGLPGSTQFYPDSNKVWAYVCGEKGLLGQNYLAKIGPDQFITTTAGRQEAKQCQTLPRG